jgi:CBS domain-containing protein
MALIDEAMDQDDLSEYYLDHDEKRYSAISTESVRSLDPAKPISLTPDDSLQTAIAVMQDKRIGAIMVVEDQRPVGIFTERDVLAKVIAKVSDLNVAQLKDYMTSNPICLRSDDSIAYALNQMTVGGFRHVPIIDKQGRVTGIISVRDIAEYVASLVPGEVYNIRPEPLRGGFISCEGG